MVVAALKPQQRRTDVFLMSQTLPCDFNHADKMLAILINLPFSHCFVKKLQSDAWIVGKVEPAARTNADIPLCPADFQAIIDVTCYPLRRSAPAL
jgi:hypothetical protein